MKKIVKLLSIIILLLWAGHSNAQYAKILDFNNTNGNTGYGSLISDGTYFYGLTSAGGSSGSGLLFKIKTDGTGYQKLLDFDGINNGNMPFGSLILSEGYLYGETALGGAHFAGTIFKIKTNGTDYHKLFDFDATTNGSVPYRGFMLEGGYFYGMTPSGGPNNLGVLFKIKKDGTGYQKLLDFDGTNGGIPYGNLISDGTFLYGMTSLGGANNSGLVFKLKPDGTGYQDIMDFNSTNGKTPYGSLYNDGTFLYGMTVGGGSQNLGVVFKVKPDGSGFQKMVDFDSTNGGVPYGALHRNGEYLYAMTSVGGANDKGVVFKIKPDGTGFTKMLNFDGSNGEGAFSSFISDGTNLYGMTTGGGAAGYGVAFSLNLLTTLPVTLSSFTGVLQNSKAQLQWLTGIEANFDHFELQKSLLDPVQTGNATSFSTIANIPGKGNHSNYEYSVLQLEASAYYRLKMVDIDGRTKFSNVILLSQSKAIDAMLYPNPATDFIHVNTIAPGDLRVYDATGKWIKSQTLQVGINTIDVSRFPRGVYYVRLNGNKLIFIKK